MKTIKYFLLMAVALITTASCTHNDGDINGWYGTWHIDRIESAIHPNTNPIPEGVDYYVQFQSSVMCLRYTDELHDGGESYGTWSEENGMMRIDFNGNFDVTGLFPQRTTLEVVSHEGNKAQLRFSTLDNVVNYYLTRQP